MTYNPARPALPGVAASLDVVLCIVTGGGIPPDISRNDFVLQTASPHQVLGAGSAQRGLQITANRLLLPFDNTNMC